MKILLWNLGHYNNIQVIRTTAITFKVNNIESNSFAKTQEVIREHTPITNTLLIDNPLCKSVSIDIIED